MKENGIPWPVIVIACLYLLVGIGGFALHFPELLAWHPDAIGIEVTELIAVVCGVFLLQRRNWARWLTLMWIIFHVGLSLFDPIGKLLIHAAFCVLIAWALFQDESERWFQRSSAPI